MRVMALSSGAVNSTELVAALINQKDDLVAGIQYAQSKIDGSLTLLIMTEDGDIIAARDFMGRLPVLVGADDDGHCVAFESFAYHKLGYHDEYELGPAEIVRLTPDAIEVLSPARDEMKMCAFMWVYYGYPNSNYEGMNVEVMRYRNGAIMARDEAARGACPEVDFVAGVPIPAFPMPSATRPRARCPSAVRSLSTRPPGRARSCRRTRICATRSPT